MLPPLRLLLCALGARALMFDLECEGNDNNNRASPPANLGVFTDLAMGTNFACALTTSDGIRCWGGSTTNVPSSLDNQRVDSLLAGNKVACAVRDKVVLECWGDNKDDAYPAGTEFDEIHLGSGFACKLVAGTVTCIGSDAGTAISDEVKQGTVAQLQGNSYGACALNADRTVACWGSNGWGVGVVKPGLPNVTRFVTGSSQKPQQCVQLQDSSYTCWGGTEAGKKNYLPTDTELNEPDVADVIEGGWTICAVRNDRSVDCWSTTNSVPNDWMLDATEGLAVGNGFVCRYKTATSTATTSTFSSTTSLATADDATSTTSSSASSSTTFSSSTSETGTSTSTMSTSNGATPTSPIPSIVSVTSSSPPTLPPSTTWSTTVSASTSSSTTFSSSSSSTSSSITSTTKTLTETQTATPTRSSTSRTQTSLTSSSTSVTSSSTSVTSSSTSVTSSSTTRTKTSVTKTSTVTSVTKMSSSTVSGTSTTLKPTSTGTSVTSTATSSVTSTTRTSTKTLTTTPQPRAAATTVTTTTTQTLMVQVAEHLEELASRLASEALDKLGNDTRASVQTPEGVLTLLSLEKLAGNVAGDLFLNAEDGNGGGVAASQGLLRSGKVLTMLRPASDPFEKVGAGLAAPSLVISLLDEQMKRVQQLDEPLFFRLPGTGSGEGAQCVYLEAGEGEENLRWSSKGVRKATEAEVQALGLEYTGVWCRTEHLSIFAALLQAVLGCTNLELISPEAMSAVTEHKGWWETSPALLLFSAVAVILVLMLAGWARELWALRLGRTHEPAKSVSLRGAFVKWGPQVVKYKYAAFLVLARDIFQCMRAGRSNLRVPTLKNAIQKCLAVRTGVSTACVAQHCWNGGAWMETKESLPHAVLCNKLEFHSGGAEEVIEHELRCKDLDFKIRRFVIAFLAGHPLLDALRLGAGSLTVKKRSTMQLASFVGVLATNAMIFNFSGSQRSWEADSECPIPPTSDFFILVATVVSLILNILPNQFLAQVAKQVHGRRGWEALFWMLCLFYLLGSAFLVVLALANLNDKDQHKWFASLRWSMIIKFLGMPAVQALRNNIMLEHFLQEDSSSNHIEEAVGIKDPREQALLGEEEEAVQQMAKRAVTVEGLVRFAALLGDKLMPGCDVATCTSEEVLAEAISPFYSRQPTPEESSVRVEVREAQGLQLPRGKNAALSCEVQLLGPQGPVSQQKSWAISSQGGVTCTWNFSACFPGVELRHALGFNVLSEGKVIARAQVAMEEVLVSRDGTLELSLYPAEAGAGSFQVPPVMSSQGISASGGTGNVGVSRQAKVLVKVRVPPATLQSLAQRELRALGDREPTEECEVGQERGKMLEFAVENCRPLHFAPVHLASGNPTPTETPETPESVPPADRLVVHCLKGSFMDLVGAVLVDALEEEQGVQEAVRAMLRDRDFNGVLHLLRQQGREKRRYWLNMMATEMAGGSLWHKDMLLVMPSLIRNLKRDCCCRMAADLRRGLDPSCSLPQQLIVLDRQQKLLRDSSCVAEVMLADAMSLAQKLVLHPEHLTKPGLAGAFQELLQEPKDVQQLPWTAPYVNDRAAVGVALASLAVKANQQQGGEERRDLGFEDIAAVAAGTTAARDRANGGEDAGEPAEDAGADAEGGD